jgi:methanogenic corrinoid protein MtbC1
VTGSRRTGSRDLAEDVERLDAAVAGGDVDGALTLVDDLLDEGLDPLDVVDVIAAVQKRVGERWQSAEWSVAQEHAATAVATSALESVRRISRGVVPERGRIVIACAEHEWHALPAMLVSAALRSRGWHVTLLGASTPTARLNRYLQDLGPDITAVSCSVASGLPHSRAFIEASTTAGIPVLAGGAAFGPDARRAAALGATAWAPDARTAVEVVETLPLVVRAAAPLPSEVTVEHSALVSGHRALVSTIAEAWTPYRDAASEDQELLRDIVDQAVHAVGGALLTGDERLLAETSTWVLAVLEARGHASEAWSELGSLLLNVLRDYPVAGGLLKQHWAPESPAAV